ncbi:MAG: 50S ribosomal protein L30 [Gammaproteobacteria bacterium CG_4_10_14_0_8_um_filter_38_16]|nr:MAG: 50S ribosomal protein L30 [Gammaproteobacteria bacterium CG_4_10_14_0_8_um_filter_38_16]PJA02957.1 MAG: 50S ribosomal protein L30 [Gammaproteobacteria bacterium CG_4_10_14_0_2_um_filter_38_22]
MVENKKKTKTSGKKLKVTLVHSKFGRKPLHAECVKGLGLRRIHQSVVVEDTACNRGMIQKAFYLLDVQEV